MMTHSAWEMYQSFRDPTQTLSELYRKRLGKPYEIGGGILYQDDFMVNCYDEPYNPEFFPDGKRKYYMGVDQGNEFQVAIAQIQPGKKRPQVVHIELVPFGKGFVCVGS